MKLFNTCIIWLALLPFSNAIALTLDFNCITANDVTGAHCAAGEAQFSVDITQGSDPRGIDIIFNNVDSGSSLSPSIAEVYFQTSLFTSSSPVPADHFTTTVVSTRTVSGVDVAFTRATSVTLAGNEAGFSGEFFGAMGSGTGTPNRNWVDEGEYLWMNISTLSFSLFETALAAGDFNIGLLALEFDADGNQIFNESFVTAVSAVPVPAAVWLFGTALLGLFGVSRKRAS